MEIFKYFHSIFPDQRLAPAEMYVLIYPVRFLLYLSENWQSHSTEAADATISNVKNEQKMHI